MVGGQGRREESIELWTAVLVPRIGACWGRGDVAGDPPIALVAEMKAANNRVHLDLVADDRPAEVARLQQLGATVPAAHELPGLAWTVLADPDGNEFCVAEKAVEAG